jgi:hypothetical protein
MSRLDCGFIVKKLKPLIQTASSESLRTCLETLRINFLEFEAGLDKTLFYWLLSRENFLLMKHVSEWTFHNSEGTLLVRITYRWREKTLQLLHFLELGCLVMPMKMYPVPEKYLTGTDNFWRTSTTDGSLWIIPWDLHLMRKVIWLRVLANWIFRHSNFLKEGYIPGLYCTAE